IEDTVDHYAEIKAGCLLIDERFQIFIILDLTNEGVAEVSTLYIFYIDAVFRKASKYMLINLSRVCCTSFTRVQSFPVPDRQSAGFACVLTIHNFKLRDIRSDVAYAGCCLHCLKQADYIRK